MRGFGGDFRKKGFPLFFPLPGEGPPDLRIIEFIALLGRSRGLPPGLFI